MEAKGTAEPAEMVTLEGWTLPDNRIAIAAAVAIRNYYIRKANILDELRTNPKASIFTSEEQFELADRLMRRLVERS